MGHLSANPMGPSPSGEGPLGGASGSKGRRWLWIVALAVVIAVGFWYFRGSRSSTEAQGPGGPGGAAAGKGQGRQGAGAGGFTVPVVVATAQRGDRGAGQRTDLRRAKSGELSRPQQADPVRHGRDPCPETLRQ